MDESSSLHSTFTESFAFPVERAVVLTTQSISIERYVQTFVRDSAGRLIESVTNNQTVNLEPGDYLVELGLPFKVFLQFEGAVEISLEDGSTTITFPSPIELAIGARSTHKKPRRTVTTTGDPVDLMRAVSTFGDALKTLSPERSFPTLRGYPPLLEVDSAGPATPEHHPQRDLWIELPPTLGDVIAVAPLAYYLGAGVRAGDSPALVSDDGWHYSIGGDQPLPTAASQLLKQVFLLDCVVRTAGLYPVPLHHRTELERRVSIAPDELYHLTPNERLRSYLEFDYTDFEGLIPRWSSVAVLAPGTKAIRMLPHLVKDLALITVTSDSSWPAIDGSFREYATRWGSPTSEVGTECGTIASETSPMEWVGVGDGIAPGCTKAIEAAYRNRLAAPERDGDVRMDIVINDTEFDTEGEYLVDEYTDTDEFPIEVNTHRQISKSELEALFKTPIDFLHYIGHCGLDGFECHDGFLDASELTANRVTFFLLNSCHSIHQGYHLINSGSVGGIGTFGQIMDSSAAWLGMTLGKLLSRGYSFSAAIDIVRDDSLSSNQYLVIGAGSSTVRTPRAIPSLLSIEAESRRLTRTKITYYPTDFGESGTLVKPFINGMDEYGLAPGELELTISYEELREFLSLESTPVRLNEELQWSDEVADLPLSESMQPD